MYVLGNSIRCSEWVVGDDVVSLCSRILMQSGHTVEG